MPLSEERVHRNLTDFQGIIKPTGFNGLITISGLGLLPALLTLLKSFPGNHIHFLLSICLLWSPAIFSKTLSDDARISILTCGPGKPLYATFGHSAIRVHDPVNSIDDVYNFGTYDFNTKNFYLKFLTGSLDYSLTVSSFSGFVNAYISENRWVYEQQLYLSGDKMQHLYDTLITTGLPENRCYHYDFFSANCATKVIDYTLAVSGDKKALEQMRNPSGMTYRDALKHYLGGRDWTALGVNMMLGPYADQEISKLQTTFLPDFLLTEIENSGLSNSPREIAGSNFNIGSDVGFSIPMVIFWVLLFLLVLEVFWFNSSDRTTDFIDLALFSISVLLGMLFMFLWIWSNHMSLRFNLNILWANPSNIIAIWAILKGKIIPLRIYLGFYVLLLFFLLINWNRLPQEFPMELMPVVTIYVFRATNRLFQFKKREGAVVDMNNT